MSNRATDDERSQSFHDAYDQHDVGEGWIYTKLHRHGFTVENLGIDKRTEDIDDPSVRPDHRVSNDGEVKAYVESKTKDVEYANWFGRLNYRHFKSYVTFAKTVEEPVILYFAVVDGDWVVREGFIPVYSMDQIVETMVPNSNPNKVVQLDESDVRSFPWVLKQLSR